MYNMLWGTKRISTTASARIHVIQCFILHTIKTNPVTTNMDRKRPAEAYIKSDPAKRVKKEDSGDYFDLSSIPRASPINADYSSSTVVKTESNGDRKPLQQVSHP